MSKPDVIIAGAGLAGLCCARHLNQEGLSVLILEASDGVGGRVRTDSVDGFLLDRGFQVLLTAYPEAQDVLDYGTLRLRAFDSGALVRKDGRFFYLSDPYRDGRFLGNLFAPIGSFFDKLRVSKLRAELLRTPIEEIFENPEISARQALLMRRFSEPFVEEFFRPLFGGVLLDTKLACSSRMFEFVFKMMSEGDAAVPELGMGEIPKQIAAELPEGSIRLESPVASIKPGQVTLESGETLTADNVVVAADGASAMNLIDSRKRIQSRSVCCLYFDAPEPPISEPRLVLGGSSRGIINNLAVMNMVSPHYAPKDRSLVSISVIGVPARDDRSLESMVRGQLRRWYGRHTSEWRLLRIYRIENAQPVSVPQDWRSPVKVEEGLYICGDHRATPSIQGAMESGRLAAESLLRTLRNEPEPEFSPSGSVVSKSRRGLRSQHAPAEEIDPDDID